MMEVCDENTIYGVKLCVVKCCAMRYKRNLVVGLRRSSCLAYLKKTLKSFLREDRGDVGQDGDAELQKLQKRLLCVYVCWCG